MSELQQIALRIGTDGQVQAETFGIKGPKCLESIEILESILEAETRTSTFTHEYSETTYSSTIEARNDLSQS